MVDAFAEDVRLSDEDRWESGGRPPGRRPGRGLGEWLECSGDGEEERAGVLAAEDQVPGLHMAEGRVVYSSGVPMGVC